MYSSIDNPTHEEWVSESNRLLNELKEHFNYYTEKINECQDKQDDFMIKFYCLKLLDANKRLEMKKISIA
jgi:hypothetical protein